MQLFYRKLWLIMRLTTFFILLAMVTAFASGKAQSVSFRGEHVKLQTVFEAIKQQTGYSFFYRSKDLKNAKPITVDLKETPLSEFLDRILSKHQLTYDIQGKTVFIKNRLPNSDNNLVQDGIVARDTKGLILALLEVRGRVVDSLGSPLQGASIRVLNAEGKRTTLHATTDKGGYFVLSHVPEQATLEITYVGHITKQIKAGRELGSIRLLLKTSVINEVTVSTGYWQSTQRLNTGNIARISTEEIARQPVGNPLSALSGRIPGLEIKQLTGVPGGGVSVQLRGKGSLLQGSDPLIIIDGVPTAVGLDALNQLNSAASRDGGMSPLTLINPATIEHIEVLKDADATAIYGSRGANGVILITTKRAKEGQTSVDVRSYHGWSRTTRTMDMLNTQQYLMMRREAFANDGIVPSVANAPDLFLLDTTHYTDYKDLLIGNTAKTNDIQLSMSGGSAAIRYRVNGGYRKETTVFPTDLGSQIGNINFQLQSQSLSEKLRVVLTGGYSGNSNNLNVSDLTSYLATNPMVRPLNSDGSLNWGEGSHYYSEMLGVLDGNPFAFTKQAYKSSFTNLNANLQLSYSVAEWLSIRLNSGYNAVSTDENASFPSTSLDPYMNAGMLPYSLFANGDRSSWLLEPQAEFQYQIGPGRLTALAGSTWQQQMAIGHSISGYDYTSDALLKSVKAAGRIEIQDKDSRYHYQGIYGRLHYGIRDKYMVNLSGRRDGSSRFGPEERFNNFAALGVAWLISEEAWAQEWKPFVSFAKLRSSWGVTGNDHIGNYRYLSTWDVSNITYNANTVLNPSALSNPTFAWERNRKLEVSLEIGSLQDRMMLSATYFRNLSDNQLINYSLPSQTGFGSVLTNRDAKIMNQGWEFVFTYEQTFGAIKWQANLNLTASQNKLLAFPGLETSSYRNLYQVGMPITALRVYRYQGIDPKTGGYQIDDVDGDGIIGTSDRVGWHDPTPKFFGGLENTLRYKGFEMAIFLEFRKQQGVNFALELQNSAPGFNSYNVPVTVLTRWRKEGDRTEVPRFFATDSQMATQALYFRQSSGIYTDASFIRARNISLSYNVNQDYTKSLGIQHLQFFANMQNAFVITGYRGADPENQSLFTLPPLRTLAVGMQFKF